MDGKVSFRNRQHDKISNPRVCLRDFELPPGRESYFLRQRFRYIHVGMGHYFTEIRSYSTLQ